MGGGLRQSLKFDKLKRLPVLTPPLEEQQAIANFLDHETARIDTLIEKQERLIALLKEKRQAVISHAVTQGLDPSVPMKDSGVEWLGEVPEHWERKKLKHLFRFTKRQDYKELPVLSVYREFGVILKDSRDDNNNRTPQDLSSYQLVEKDHLVINKMKAWQGSLGISNFLGITSPDYAVYEPNHNELSEFLHHMLRSQDKPSLYRSISNGVRPSQWRLELEKFEQLYFFIPPTKGLLSKIYGPLAAWVDFQVHDIKQFLHLDKCESHTNFS